MVYVLHFYVSINEKSQRLDCEETGLSMVKVVVSVRGVYSVNSWRCEEKSITISRLFGQPDEREYAFNKGWICLKRFDDVHLRPIKF